MKIIFLEREDIFKDRPFSRHVKIIKILRKRGHESNFMYGIKPSNMFSKLKKIDKDSIVVCGGLKPGIFQLFLKIVRKDQIVVHDWADLYTEIQKEKGGIWSLLPPFFRILENKIIKSSDYLVTNSLCNKKKAEELGKNIKYIPNGIDKKIFKNKSGSEIKKKFKKPIILYVGSLIGVKKVDILIESVRDLDCQLLVAGFGNPDELFENSPENVEFLGLLPYDKIPGLIEASDICCSLVDWDANLKLLEYAYMKKPIITVRGNPELIFKNRVNAMIVDQDVKSVRKTIKELLDNDKLRKKLSKNLEKFRVYDWEEVADQYLDFLKSTKKS